MKQQHKSTLASRVFQFLNPPSNLSTFPFLYLCVVLFFYFNRALRLLISRKMWYIKCSLLLLSFWDNRLTFHKLQIMLFSNTNLKSGLNCPTNWPGSCFGVKDQSANRIVKFVDISTVVLHLVQFMMVGIFSSFAHKQIALCQIIVQSIRIILMLMFPANDYFFWNILSCNRRL